MADKILDAKMFDFLIRAIRTQDELEGHGFLEKFLDGSQSVWETIQGKIFSLKKLWSVTECPDEYLTYLKRIVGWTPDIEKIINGLSDAALRRLISISVPLWKSRTTEQAIVDVLNVLVPGRSRIWNWFVLRWVLDETIFAEEHQGRDPWLLSFPDGNQEFWSNVRVVDPGVASRTLLKDVLNLMRPAGERYEVIYLKFLDLFTIDDDWSQWDVITGKTPSVAGGMLVLENDHSISLQNIVVNVVGSTSWSNYIVSARMRGRVSQAGFSFGFKFYFDPVANVGYWAGLSIGSNLLYVVKGNGSVVLIDSFDFDTIDYKLRDDTWYGLRVQISPEGATNRIKVYFDGVERINTTDATYSQGTVGLFREVNIKADCDEIEVMGLPVEKDTVEINY